MAVAAVFRLRLNGVPQPATGDRGTKPERGDHSVVIPPAGDGGRAVANLRQDPLHACVRICDTEALKSRRDPDR